MSYCPACGSDYPAEWKRCPTDEAALLGSRNISKYRVDSIIGTGGMGAVYKAFNPDTQSPVAVKLMHPAASGVDAARARFQREAASVAAVRTRHLVTIFDFGTQSDGTMYLVMEYLEGHDLRPEIKTNTAMPLARVNLIVDGALRGLGAAHKKGIVHRDLKPENIFVAQTEDGEVAKVLDFGIAQVQTSSEQSVLTKEGALMGTPAYMAPEQVGGNRGEIGPWTDVYAMGVIVYEMLTGLAPFEDESVTAILSKVLTRDFLQLREVKPDLPPALLDVVDCAMADQYADRFADANGFRQAWNAAYATLDPAIATQPVPAFRLTGDRAAVTPSTGRGDPLMATAAVSEAEVGSSGSASTAGSGPAHGKMGTAETFMSPAKGVQPPPQIGGSPGLGTAPTLAPPNSQQIARRAAELAAQAEDSPNSHPGQGSRSDEGGPATTAAMVQSTSRKGLWFGLVGLATAAAATAYILANRGEDSSAPQPRPIAGTIADAGSSGLDASAADNAPDASANATAATTANMLLIPAGRYAIEGFHAVDVSGFFLDKTEMTVAQFKAAMAASGNPRVVPGPAEFPVRDVTWDEANTACEALGKRLPSEVEWEYAATRSPLDPRGARLRQKGSSRNLGPAKVGTHRGDCTPEGLCDMLGNVSEWMSDVWRVNERSAPVPAKRSVRGGSFTVAPRSRYAKPRSRAKVAANTRDAELGLRCARDREP